METSVIVIAYNEEKDIRDCIGAILNQTIKDFELIVVDDGSTDCTGKIVLSFKDPRIKYFKSKKNQGYASARNKGIKHSKGKFIFFTDADCVPKSDWLYQGLKKIKESETIAVVGGKTYFPRTGSSYSASDRVTFEKTYFPPPKRNIASTSNLVYRRSILERVSGFNTRYNDGSEDTDMRLRISRLSGFLLKHNSRMIVYHKFKSMQLNEALSIIKRMSNHVLLIKDHKDHFPAMCRSYGCYWRICLPIHFVSIFFPPALYFAFRYYNMKIKKPGDFLHIINCYFLLFVLRVYIWKKAFQERIFII